MNKYEVRTILNSYAWTIVEAENEEQAQELAKKGDWTGWKIDTDWSSAGDFDTQLAEQAGA